MSCEVGTDVQRAADLLRSGGLVAFPTETVYGLGADALDARAVARIFEVKQRPRFDPVIVHIADESCLDRLATHVPPLARQLIAAFWPGPLTLVLPKTGIVPDLVTSGLPTVGIRMPAHDMALDLLRRAGTPVAAPSANLFGRLSPTTASHVAEQLGDRIDYILDGGPCRVGLESTVLQIVADGEAPQSGTGPRFPVRLLRPGGLPIEEIERCIGAVGPPESSHDSASRAAPSPGMLPMHCAPRTPLVVHWSGVRGQESGVRSQESGIRSQGSGVGCEAELELFSYRTRRGFLGFASQPSISNYAAVEVLSPNGDLTEAAVNFFAALRRLDRLNLDVIVAEPFPERGLGRALNDRLRRAAHE